MTHVALLWHMHQPYYEDLATREHILPWVRLHALKDYYGMVAILREFPAVRMTFNLVPSLLVQLEAFAADRARDRFLELSLKPADALTPEEVDFVLANFFHAQRQHMIDLYPRYGELLARRGGTAATAADRRAAAARFTADDLRDLQVWHKLAWIDPLYLDHDPRVRALVAKGRGFSEDDKATLRTVELELLNKVIPEYRDAAARGQIEVSASPFYHPILPLLCDTDVYRRTHPDSRMPRERFTRPGDAAMQLERAAAYHERLFGRRPVGLWPSEGSVSDEMVPLAAAAGFRWMATDELILARTLGLTFSRDGRGHVEQPERLYKPYVVRAGGAQVACAFRDHVLSDLIGFTYSGWPAEAAAEDFVLRLVEAGRPLPRADRRGRGAHPDHPRRRECLGAFRGRRPAVPAGALPPSVRPPRAEDRHHGRGVRGEPTRSCRGSSRAPGSTRTSTSGSAMPTTRRPGASWPMPATRSTSGPSRRRSGRRRRGARRSC